MSRSRKKRVRRSSDCRNHGSCQYCSKGRKHPAKRRRPADEKEQLAYQERVDLWLDVYGR